MSIDLLRYAQGENVSDTLSASIGSSDTTIPVNNISKWSTNGGNVIIDRGTSSQEIIVVTGVSGSSLVVASGGRGFDGTTAVGHNSGATIESVPFAKDWNDLITALLNILVIAGTLDTTKVATPSMVSTFAGDFANYVHSGLTIPTSATLSATSTSGNIYYGGSEISVASDGGHTYTASNDCYVDVSNAGAYTYNTVANGAAAPSLTANSIRIAKVVTSGTAVTGVTQDGSLDSLGNVIYPSNPHVGATLDIFKTKGIYPNGNSGAAITINALNGDRQSLVVSANTTISLSNFAPGTLLKLYINENATGGYTITLPTGKWPGGTAGTFTTTANAKNTLIIDYDGTDYMYQLAAGFA